MRLSRRALLQAFTVGASGLAFAVDGRGDLVRTARGDSPPTPKRIVIFPIANGVSDYTDMVADGSTETSFTLGPMTSPLATLGLQDQMVLIDNIEIVKPTLDVDYHFCGLTQLLTGSFSPDFMNQKSTHISLDRYLGKKLGASLAWPQLNMGTMCDSVSYSYNDDGTSVASNTDPLDLYSKVFAGLTPSGPDDAQRRRLARRKNVLDTVTGDLSAFRASLPAADIPRADAQLAAIEAMENRISIALQGNANCKNPAIAGDVDYKSDESVPETMRAFIDLTVAAMACDQTRVVLMHSYLREYHPPNYKCPWPPANRPNDDFHGLSHDTAGDQFESFRRAKAFHFQLAGELAQKLKAIPEGDGQTMLDNTVIFVPSEIGRGHTHAGLQFVTIGGGGLGIKTGRYMRVGGDREVGQGVPHQRLLVSLLQAMGLDDQTFGEDGGTGTGPLLGFRTG